MFSPLEPLVATLDGANGLDTLVSILPLAQRDQLALEGRGQTHDLLPRLSGMNTDP
jgi:hypothetical protein